MRAGHGCVIRPRITGIVRTIDASFSLVKAAFCQKPLFPFIYFFPLPDDHLRLLDGSTKAPLSWIGTALGDNARFAFNSGLWQTSSLYHRTSGLIYMVLIRCHKAIILKDKQGKDDIFSVACSCWRDRASEGAAVYTLSESRRLADWFYIYVCTSECKRSFPVPNIGSLSVRHIMALKTKSLNILQIFEEEKACKMITTSETLPSSSVNPLTSGSSFYWTCSFPSCLLVFQNRGSRWDILECRIPGSAHVFVWFLRNTQL